jgi:hypothetical protein
MKINRKHGKSIILIEQEGKHVTIAEVIGLMCSKEVGIVIRELQCKYVRCKYVMKCEKM